MATALKRHELNSQPREADDLRRAGFLSSRRFSPETSRKTPNGHQLELTSEKLWRRAAGLAMGFSSVCYLDDSIDDLNGYL